MEKIKLLHISETFASGVYTYIKNICKYLENDNSFQIYVLYSVVRQENENEEVINRDFSKNVVFIPISLSREISIKSDLKGLKNIRNIINEIKPNIVHLHSSKAGILGRLACVGLNNTKVLYTPHGYSFIREDISKFKRYFFLNIEKYITKLFKGDIIACGDSEYEIAKKFTNNVFLVRNGIKLDKLNLPISNNSKDPIIIGTSGRIHMQKNPQLFNKIAKLLPNFKFIWIGDGEYIKVLNSSNITVTGWKTNEEVMELITKIDVFISTSLWEGLPFNIIEAMALGKPIVSKNIEGNKITVEQGINGFLCNEPIEFVDAIKKCVSNLKTFEKASRERAESLFDLEKNLMDLKRIYLK
ncbi:glycosyltransferase [Myroides injenensis]|uniref:glycosyltransferase n=1 Tax=Myroides injenensis TaxID=1183151 RepID=UPI000289E904|nr:glycosyltransferase [Myroides injenensis]